MEGTSRICEPTPPCERSKAGRDTVAGVLPLRLETLSELQRGSLGGRDNGLRFLRRASCEASATGALSSMSLPEKGTEHLPELFEIFVGSSRGPSYGAWWDGRVVIYESFGAEFRDCEQLLLAPSSAQWQRFWRSMDDLGVWKWDDRYEPGERFEPQEVPGPAVHWSLGLAHCGRRASSSGDGAGPGSVDLDESLAFTAFLSAVTRLLSGQPFV